MPVLVLQAVVERGAIGKVCFPTILSGALVTSHSWGGGDTIVRSLDGAAFSAATNAPTPIATSSGVHSLVLEDTETDADIVVVKITSGSAAYDPVLIFVSTTRDAFTARLAQIPLAASLRI